MNNGRRPSERRNPPSVRWTVILLILFLLLTGFIIAYSVRRTNQGAPHSLPDPTGTGEPDPVGGKITAPLPVTEKPPFSGIPSTSSEQPPAVSDPVFETDPVSDTTQTPSTRVTEFPQTTLPIPVVPNVPSSPVVLTETEDAGSEYIDRITFIGDSTTYGMLYYEVLSGGKNSSQVWVPKSGTLALFRASYDKILCRDDGLEYYIPDAVAQKKPEILVITLGVNGVSSMDENSFKKDYGKLIENIRKADPETEIILQSIFPVSTTYELLDKINNTKISAANGWILELAEEYSLHYLDTRSVLSDEAGNLFLSFQNGDGMHLNAAGFEAVLGYIRTHALLP